MGMYDTLICETKVKFPKIKDPMELKDVNFNSRVYQTKSLASALNHYSIGNDKKLRIVLGHDDVFNKDFTCEMDDFFGDIHFYEFISSQEMPENRFDYWIEFVAKVVGGNVKSIRLAKFQATDNTESKKIRLEQERKLDAYLAFRKTWHSRYLWNPYNNTIDFIFRQIRRFGSKFPLWRIERFLKLF